MNHRHMTTPFDPLDGRPYFNVGTSGYAWARWCGVPVLRVPRGAWLVYYTGTVPAMRLERPMYLVENGVDDMLHTIGRHTGRVPPRRVQPHKLGRVVVAAWALGGLVAAMAVLEQVDMIKWESWYVD